MTDSLPLDYPTLEVVIQVIQYFVSITLAIAAANFVKDFLVKKWSFYNVLLTIMCILTISSSIIEAVAPNETLVVQLRSNVVPFNPTLKLINVFFNGIGYFCAISVYYWISFLRSWSLVQLRPQWERRGLKAAVVFVTIVQQAAMVLWFIEVITQVTDGTANTTSSVAAMTNFLIDSYYLSRFISFIRKSSKTLALGKNDAKLLVISKYGIAQITSYFIAIAINFVIPAGHFRDVVMSQVVNLGVWFFCMVLIAMSYKLRSLSNPGNVNSTKVPEVSKSENTTTIASKQIITT